MTETQSLSERELEVLRLVAQGATNQQIAHELSISSNTVKVHLRNIYSKLGVMSRTEATVEAVRRGIIILPGPIAQVVEERLALPTPVGGDETGTEAAEREEDSSAQGMAVAVVETERLVEEPAVERREQTRTPPALTRRLLFAGVAALLLFIAAISASFALRETPDAQTLPQAGWDRRAPLPEPRADLALAFSDGELYAIAGEGPAGVSGAVWRYDPLTNSWKALAGKPLPVAEISAAVLGRNIYVPGGRTSTGDATAEVEVYKPQEDRWERRAPLPEPRSGFGLAAIEGRLYLFGGRNQNGPTRSVFIYDPALDRWSEGPPLPYALAYPAVVAVEEEGRAYLIGGEGADGPLTTMLRFTPGAVEPWEEKAALPSPKSRAAAVDLAGTIYLIGTSSGDDTVLSYDLRSDRWDNIGLEHGRPLSRMGAVIGDRDVYVIGGWDGTQLLAENRVFRPVYRTYLPLAPSK
ncbi:MAG: LuxR family transcriptional regulator [Herpetosiphonaceae bacterium]|nr:MAG: LuxR family transcriptional regulator [Herpetosiphonaceae bacterium]